MFIYSKQYKSTLTLPTFIRKLIVQIANLISRIFNELACPARFERATYALEEFVAAQKAIYFNSLQRKNAAVQ